MKRLAISLLLLISGCFEVTVSSNYSGTGSGVAQCTLYTAGPTTRSPGYDHALSFTDQYVGDSEVKTIDHAAYGLTAGSRLWVTCNLSDGGAATGKVICSVEDPEARDFLDMTINADGSVLCLKGVSPP